MGISDLHCFPVCILFQLIGFISNLLIPILHFLRFSDIMLIIHYIPCMKKLGLISVVVLMIIRKTQHERQKQERFDS